MKNHFLLVDNPLIKENRRCIILQILLERSGCIAARCDGIAKIFEMAQEHYSLMGKPFSVAFIDFDQKAVIKEISRFIEENPRTEIFFLPEMTNNQVLAEISRRRKI